MAENVTPINTGTQADAWTRATAERNWLVFAVTQADPVTGKTGKFPTDRVESEYIHERVNFDGAVSTDQAARYTFAEVTALLGGLDPQRPDITHYAVGYLPRPGSALVVGDLDNCRDPVTGKIADWAVGVLKAGPAYAEVSASLTGIRVLMERMDGDDQHTSGERNGAGFFANGKRGAVLTFNQLPGHDIQPVKTPTVRDAILNRRGHMAKASERATSDIDDPVSYERVAQVLAHIPNDASPNGAENKRGLSYDDWRDIGYAIKHALGDDGWPLFEWWSAQAEKTKPAKTKSIWKGLHPDGSITFGKLVHWAKAANGGMLPAQLRPVMDQRRAERHLAHAQAALALGNPWADIPDFPDAPWLLAQNPAPGATLVDVSQLANVPVKPREWTVPDLVPRKHVTLLTGHGGVGKSLLALQLAAAVAMGKLWLGQLAAHGNALYVGAEDDIEEMHRRIADICTGYQVVMQDVHNMRLWSLAGQDAVMATVTPDGLVQTTQLFEQVKAQAAAVQPEVLVLDTLADLFAGDENSRSQGTQFVNLLVGLAIEFNCAVVLLAHPSKSGRATGDGTSGSTSWHNKVRSRLYLTRRQAEDGIEPDPKQRVLDHMKANYASDDNQLVMRWDKGCFVPVGAGELPSDGDAMFEWKASFLRMLDLFTSQGREVSAGHTSTLNAPKLFSEHASNDGTTKKQYKLAMELLEVEGVIKAVESRDDRNRPRKIWVRT